MTEDIKDISLSQKKKFRIDGDDSRMLELDVSDMNILVRMEERYPKMEAEAREAAVQMSKMDTENPDEDSMSSIATLLKSIDEKMREDIDFIFDSNVSEMCAPKGTMYDPYNGQFRFEHIIEVLTTLYANNLTAEYKKMQDRVKKHTAKYTGKRKR